MSIQLQEDPGSKIWKSNLKKMIWASPWMYKPSGLWSGRGRTQCTDPEEEMDIDRSITIYLPEEGYKFQLLLGHPTSTVEASRSLWSQYNPNRWWCPTARRVYTVSLYNIQCILCTVHSVYSVYYTVNTSKNTQNPPRRQKLCLGHLEGTLVGLCRRT